MSMEYRTLQGEAAMAAAATNSSSSVDNDDYSHAIVKGKRAKRRRLRNYLPVPVPAAATPSTSSSSSAAAASGSIVDEEEEDMANCLILLAQGRALKEAGLKPEARIEGEGGGGCSRSERYTSRRLAEAATMTNGKVRFYVYECKTCNKCFPSFQALGGHRSSHKKIKMATLMAASQEKKPSEELIGLHLRISTSYTNSQHPNPLPPNATTPRNNNNVKNSGNNNINDIMINTSRIRQKVHECSICGAEFSSGQALGGHMRRHRAEPIPQGSGVPLVQEMKEKGAVLPLDLNLPAPAEDDVDHRGDHSSSPSFGFPRKRPLVFSPSSLVDCHYY